MNITAWLLPSEPCIVTAPDSGGNASALVTPTVSIQPLRQPESADSVAMTQRLEKISYRLNQQFQRMPFGQRLDISTVRANLLQPNPPSIYPVRWLGHECFCAWRAGELVGLLDIAAGFDNEAIELSDYQPFGYIRFLLLPEVREQTDSVVPALFAAADKFWQQHHVGHIKAFHRSTGYPQFQAGLGALPGDWAEHIRLFTANGFQLTDRFYGFRRPLDQPGEEYIPIGQLSLVFRGKPSDRHYHLYRQIDQIGQARVVELQCDWLETSGSYPQRNQQFQPEPTVNAIAERQTSRIATLVDIQIHPEWRGQDLGKWLLRRVLNDALMQGYHQILVHVPHRSFVMQNLLIQQGFQEQTYRGYTLEKSLTS